MPCFVLSLIFLSWLLVWVHDKSILQPKMGNKHPVHRAPPGADRHLVCLVPQTQMMPLTILQSMSSDVTVCASVIVLARASHERTRFLCCVCFGWDAEVRCHAHEWGRDEVLREQGLWLHRTRLGRPMCDGAQKVHWSRARGLLGGWTASAFSCRVVSSQRWQMASLVV